MLIDCRIKTVSKGNIPWYVGKAEKRGFHDECFQHHKLTHYNNCIGSKKGTPLLTLIPKCTQGDKFTQPNGSSYSDISTLEKMLIVTCILKNDKLANTRDTKLCRDMVLPGYINTPKGRPAETICEFKSLIGV